MYRNSVASIALFIIFPETCGQGPAIANTKSTMKSKREYEAEMREESVLKHWPGGLQEGLARQLQSLGQPCPKRKQKYSTHRQMEDNAVKKHKNENMSKHVCQTDTKQPGRSRIHYTCAGMHIYNL